MIALINGNERIAKLLIDTGRNINYRYTASLLTDADVAMGTIYERRDSPLQQAVKMGRIDLVRLLIHAGASNKGYEKTLYGEIDSEEARNPLQIAADIGRWDIVNLIIDEGNDLHLELALRITYNNSMWERMDGLLGRGANVNTHIEQAVEKDDTERAKTLIERYKAFATAQPTFYDASFQYAVDHENIEIARLLLGLGVTLKGNELLRCVQKLNEDMLKVLMDAGAVDLDADGW